MREYLAVLLMLLSISYSYAQLPLNVISDFFQQSPRFATGFVLGIVIIAISKSSLSSFFPNEQDRNRIAVALGVGTIILFQFAVPEFVISSTAGYMSWAIVGAIGLVLATMVLKRSGGAPKMNMFTVGIIIVLIALLLEFLGVNI